MSLLSRLSLANKSIVALVAIIILLVGVYVIPSLRQELLPAVVSPSISIVSVYPGASPAQVEQDVTNPLEQNLKNLTGVQQYQSQSSENLSVITVQYGFGTDLAKAQQTLQEQVNQDQQGLPTNVTTQLQTFSSTDIPIINLSIVSSQNPIDLAQGIKQVVVPALQNISGVSNVKVTGVRKQIVTITLNMAQLQAAGISVSQVQGALQANNITMPAGEITSNDKTVAISVNNALNSIDDINNLVVGYRGNHTSSSGQNQQPTQSAAQSSTPVKLSDVASVQEDLAPSTTLTRTNGQPSLGIAITKTPGANAVTISQSLKESIPTLEHRLGYGAQIILASDQAPAIQDSLQSLTREGLLGAGFAILVILLFLFSIRSTLVTAISIPLSVIIAFIGMWTQNYSLNILTLTALTIAIGRVVDDSIVVLENIHRHLYEGEDKRTAVLSAVKEVSKAVTASTLTTVTVFLPLAFIGGVAGEYTQPLALTVTMALFASLLVALTIVPVLAFWFLKTPQRKASQPDQELHTHLRFLERVYIPMISWVVKHRVITLLLAIVLLASSFALIFTLPINALGTQAQTSFSFSQQMPPGTSLNATDQAAQQIEQVLATTSNIQTYQVTIGNDNSGASSSTGTDNASFTVNAKPNVDATQIEQAVRNRLNQLTGIGTIVFDNQSGNNVDITVQAADQQTLRQAHQQVFTALSHVPNTSDIKSDLANSTPLISVNVNETKALKYGLTAVQVGQSLQLAFLGTTATHVTWSGDQQDVDLKIAATTSTVQQLQAMLIPGPAGNVRLGDVADVTSGMGPTEISHFNGTRTATITLTITNQNVGGVTTDVQNRIARLALPDGATAQLGAATSSQNQALTNLYVTLLVAIPLVFVVMVATFQSLIQPLILLVAIPFAAVGAIFLAAITRTAIGISSLFGFLMLIGIVVTNAIVLIDLVNQYRAKGLDARTAVIEGGKHRLRPILMTATATIMALLPMALGLSGSSANPVISGALAIIVIGGLASSTFLTLLLVPTLYVIVEDTKARFRKKPAVPPVEETTKEIAVPVV